jgi:hypothetical protein
MYQVPCEEVTENIMKISLVISNLTKILVVFESLTMTVYENLMKFSTYLWVCHANDGVDYFTQSNYDLLRDIIIL